MNSTALCLCYCLYSSLIAGIAHNGNLIEVFCERCQNIKSRYKSMVECYLSLSIWVYSAVLENKVSKIIRLIIWLSKDGVVRIYAYTLIWQGLDRFGDTVSKTSQIAACVYKLSESEAIPKNECYFVISASTMALIASMFDSNQSHKPVPKGFNLAMLAQPEFWIWYGISSHILPSTHK